MSETLDLLNWASSSNKAVVQMFYFSLCEKNGYKSDVYPNDLYSEIKLNGGNTFANLYRGCGVSYTDLAYDVAESLRGAFWKPRPYTNKDIDQIESYILEKMEVTPEVLKELFAAINSEGHEKVVKDQAAKVVTKGVAYAAGYRAAQKAAERATENALKEALKNNAGKKIAEKAATETAKRAAKAAATRAAKKAAEKAAQKVAEQLLIRIMTALNIFLLAWTVIDIAGPAMRKTIPSATYIALLRQLKKNEEAFNG